MNDLFEDKLSEVFKDVFSDDDLGNFLLEVVYEECLFNRPSVIHELLANQPGGDNNERVNRFIEIEKVNMFNKKLKRLKEMAEQCDTTVMRSCGRSDVVAILWA